MDQDDRPEDEGLFADARGGTHAARPEPARPLAERMRPRTLDDFVGQAHLTAPGAPLRRAVESAALPSMILWGPPGTGKTSLARVLGAGAGLHFVPMSAVLAGVKDIRELAGEARGRRRGQGIGTLLFLDEVHRFNKAQQDALLPHVEDGTIVLVGATTENPSFEVVPALLSRCQVFVLHSLNAEDLRSLIARALGDAPRGLGRHHLVLDPEAEAALIEVSDGDGRQLLNALESLAQLTSPDASGTRHVDLEALRRLKGRIFLRADRAGEEHWNLISALHKSVRGSDPDAALYWLARLLEGGEDPLCVARRLVRMASEDIGLAEPGALVIANAAKEAVHFLGVPEGALALAQITVYLALAPKSNALELAYKKAAEAATTSGSKPVPLHLRNAPTRLMSDQGYGRAYRYPHDFPGRWVDEEYRPDGVPKQRYYQPSAEGREPKLWATHVERIRQARAAQSNDDAPRGPDTDE
ncbi:MAG: replication-associated recombination protein A [Candidatus Eisenbacteria bacterium]